MIDEKWAPAHPGAAERIKPVIGDLTKPRLGADLICEAIRAQPKQINTRLGTFGEVAYALFPKGVDQILSSAYKVFPDSAAAKDESSSGERASNEQVALAHLMRGVHW